MRRWVSLCAALTFTALPSEAQTDSARIAALEARIAKLEAAMGPYGDSIPPTSDFAGKCPTLPNQRYSVWCRVQQIGMGIDANNWTVYALASRVGAVESRSGLGRTIRADSLILGNCLHTDLASQLAICGQGDANIHVESNLSSTQYQNPRPHVGMWSMSGDGGLRILQNAYATTNCFTDTDPTNGVQYTNCMKKFVDPTREVSMSGVDSRGRFSLLMQEPGRAYDYTQNLVVNYYYDQKLVKFESMQAGWKFSFVTSLTPRGLEIQYPLP